MELPVDEVGPTVETVEAVMDMPSEEVGPTEETLGPTEETVQAQVDMSSEEVGPAEETVGPTEETVKAQVELPAEEVGPTEETVQDVLDVPSEEVGPTVAPEETVQAVLDLPLEGVGPAEETVLELPSEEEVGPTEETVQALLDFLVDPLLPSKFMSRENGQSPPREELVAKQVYAVVLLYNYYHRKQDPGMEFLDFTPFCKLAVILKPSLLLYLSLMQRADFAELEDLDKHMSLTEKQIMNACDVSKSLDASIKDPTIEDWPISKVAVFLVDHKMENCFLFHSSITQGVWSVIEKEINIPGEEGATEARPANKKKRVVKKSVKEGQPADDPSLLQAAYSAVKEASGINQGDLKTLDTHVMYSTSKTKTAVRLYIMQFTQSNQDSDLIPINDVVDSLRGPLVRKEAGSWTITPVVEYFHLLPFADKLSNWLLRCREMHTNPSQHFEAAMEVINRCNSHLNTEQVPNPSGPFESEQELENSNSCQLKEEPRLNTSKRSEASTDIKSGNIDRMNVAALPCASQYNNSFSRKDEPTGTMVYKKRNRSEKNNNSNKFLGTKTSNGTGEYTRQEEVCAVTGSSNNTDIDESFMTCPPVNGKNSNISHDDHAGDQKKMRLVEEDCQASLRGGANVLTKVIDTSSRHHNNGKVCSDKKISDTAMSDQDGDQDHARVSFNPDSKHLHKIQLTVAAKLNLLSKTALKVLHSKRELLSQQLRSIADEIAMCDRRIETILSGGEDDLAVTIDSVVMGCNDLCKDVRFQDPEFPPLTKRKRLSEATLSVHSPCQELDDICNGNSWRLPTYTLSASEGGFQASAIVNGVDFECSSKGIISATPLEARNSAASKILTKLRSGN